MKIKFIRALAITMLALVVFLVTTFIPSLREYKLGHFLQGFSGGVGTGTLILAIDFITSIKKSKIQLPASDGKFLLSCCAVFNKLCRADDWPGV